jgi:hypothetical protein
MQKNVHKTINLLHSYINNSIDKIIFLFIITLNTSQINPNEYKITNKNTISNLISYSFVI